MAWSDAARAAALEARRMHAKHRPGTDPVVSWSRQFPKLSQQRVESTHYRMQLAKMIRVKKDPRDLFPLFHMARQSTNLRNALRKGKKK